MNGQGIKVRVRENFPTGELEIYIVDQRGGEMFLAKQMVGDGYYKLVFDQVSPADSGLKPTITIPMGIVNIFLAAVSEFALSEGIKPARHERLEGTLEAQGKHLQDMRKIVGSTLEVSLGG